MVLPLISKKRPLIEVTINGKKAIMLVDTGASSNVIDTSAAKEYNFSIRESDFNVVGAGGESKSYDVFGLEVLIGNTFKESGFSGLDLSAVRNSIQQSTGKRIQGIIGTPTITKREFKIDLLNQFISVGEYREQM